LSVLILLNMIAFFNLSHPLPKMRSQDLSMHHDAFDAFAASSINVQLPTER
jgi:hypothetical protein